MRERERRESGRIAAAMALGRYANALHSDGAEESRATEHAPFDGTWAAMETIDVSRAADHERQAGVCA